MLFQSPSEITSPLGVASSLIPLFFPKAVPCHVVRCPLRCRAVPRRVSPCRDPASVPCCTAVLAQ
eukprot:6383988-Pyramimonas_sp.AAC.1